MAQSEALADVPGARPRLDPVVGDAEIHACPDPALLALISRGDLNALGVVYDRHIQAAWRVALHFSASAAAAEQAISAVFLRLWRNPEPNDQTSLLARLLVSVRREAGESQALRGHA